MLKPHQCPKHFPTSSKTSKKSTFDSPQLTKTNYQANQSKPSIKRNCAIKMHSQAQSLPTAITLIPSFQSTCLKNSSQPTFSRVNLKKLKKIHGENVKS